ncbi:MAG: hypothetical protein MK212_13755 [Saprospiraceae bacterium]|nr:hypothetical protein [Saprospiraceae bacterium]
MKTIYTNVEEALEQADLAQTLILENLSSAEFRAQLKKLRKLPNLAHLTLKRIKLSKLPKDLFKLEGLKSLTLEKLNPKFSEIPDDIAQLVNLEVLKFGNHRLSTFPKALTTLSKLRVLKGTSYYIKTLPEGFEQLQNLEVLKLEDSSFKEMPEALPSLHKLKVLSLSIKYGDIKPFPDHAFEQMKDLEYLDLSGCGINTLSASITKLNKLKYLDLRKNYFVSIPYELLNMNIEQLYVSNKDDYLTMAKNLEYLPLIQQAKHAQDIEFAEAKSFLQILSKRSRAHIPNQYLWHAINRPDLPNLLRVHALDYVQENYEEKKGEQAPKTGNCIVFCGAPKFRNKAYKKVLDKAQIKYIESFSGALPEGTTHLVLGKKLHDTCPLELGEVILMTPQNFLDFIEITKEGFLVKEEGTSMQDNLEDLLTSSDLENVKVALELLKSGGVPKTLVTELFIAAKLSTDSSVRRKAKNFLYTHLSTQGQENFKKRLSLKDGMAAHVLIRNIKRYTEGTELDLGKIALAAYRNFSNIEDKRHLAAFILYRSNKPEREAIWTELWSGQRLDFGGMRGISLITLNSSFEEDIRPFVKVKELSLVDTDFSRYPRAFSAFKELKSIHLEHALLNKETYYSNGLEELLSNHPKLQYLGLSLYNSFKALTPAFQTKQLKELSITSGYYHSYKKADILEIPKEILQLKNLKKLRLGHEHTRFSNLEILAKLPKLQELDLSQVANLEKIPAVLQNHSRIKVITEV